MRIPNAYFHSVSSLVLLRTSANSRLSLKVPNYFVSSRKQNKGLVLLKSHGLSNKKKYKNKKILIAHDSVKGQFELRTAENKAR